MSVWTSRWQALRFAWCHAWADDHGMQLYFIDPDKPPQNADIESFNGRFRDKCRNQHWFTSIGEARDIIEDWRIDYNSERPHSSLKYQTPKSSPQRGPSTKRNVRSRWSYLMAPRPRTSLTPPNDDTQMESKLDLRVALKNGEGQPG
ncbi:transposase [Phaeobacter sp. B1627]|nr:transposase [Phaeobacter sp. B1627]